MLEVSKYEKPYIDSCEALMKAQLAAYEKLASAAKTPGAVTSFEALFFQHLVLAMDAYFAHRLRGQEGNDGNALNEVRMLAASILHHKGKLTADKTIKYKPETSVLELSLGDEVSLDEDTFAELFRAYFAEIRRKFS